MPAAIAPPSRDLAVAAPPLGSPQITPRILIRGLSRHWWRIMLCWLLLSAPLAVLIYTMVEPTYEAVSLLRADPTAPDPYGPGLHATPNMSADRIYLLTQVKLITTNSVLDAALANPAIANLPMIRKAKDPKTTLREAMRVEIVGQNTYLLEVALASKDPVEAAAIVNAVVKAYTEQHADYYQKANRSLARASRARRRSGPSSSRRRKRSWTSWSVAGT